MLGRDEALTFFAIAMTSGKPTVACNLPKTPLLHSGRSSIRSRVMPMSSAARSCGSKLLLYVLCLSEPGAPI